MGVAPAPPVLNYAPGDSCIRRGRLTFAAIMFLLYFLLRLVLWRSFATAMDFAITHSQHWWFAIVSALPSLVTDACLILGLCLLPGTFSRAEDRSGRLRPLLFIAAILFGIPGLCNYFVNFPPGALTVMTVFACLQVAAFLMAITAALLWMRHLGKRTHAGWLSIFSMGLLGLTVASQIFQAAEAIEYALHPLPDAAAMSKMSALEMLGLLNDKSPTRRFLENVNQILTPAEVYLQVIFWTVVAIWVGRRRGLALRSIAPTAEGGAR